MASNPNSPPSDVPGVPDAVARVRTYHQRTKHLPGRLATIILPTAALPVCVSEKSGQP